ncbi:hypothetical protein K2X05_06370 [bacterium]|nr:hypothetical protein [bacterium]
MKYLFLLVIIFSKIALANTTFYVGNANTESFSAEIVDPMKLTIVNLKNQEQQTLNFKHSISDIKKLTLETTVVQKNKKEKKASLEMLLVVLSVYDKEQSVRVYIPVKSEEIPIKGKLSPVCEFKNVGDFSWATDKDLEDRLRLVSHGNESKFQIKLSKLEQGSSKFYWVDCFAI